MMMAIRKSPTESTAIAAKRTPKAVGGIIMERPPPPKIGPRDIDF